MAYIDYDVIGTMLHQIWHGNPNARPPIHIDTDDDKQLIFLEIYDFWELIEPGKTLPSAVLVWAYNNRTGGPYFLYWIEEGRDELMKKISEWMPKSTHQKPGKIKFMSIGNTIG